MPTLLIFYCTYSETLQVFLIIALILGFIGDTALNSRKNVLFYLGGLAFLLEHLCLVQLFLSTSHFQLSIKSAHWLYYSIYIVYILLLIKWIHKNTITPMHLIYYLIGFIYMSILCSASFFALVRYNHVDWLTYITGLIGTLLFVLSDSLLFIKITGHHAPIIDFLLMVSYLFAQLLIVVSFM